MKHIPGQSDSTNYVVEQESGLLDWLLNNLKGESRTKIKATLAGRGIEVNGRVVTKFDFQLKPGMKISVSKSKRNGTFKSRYVNIVYEDKYLVVIEKNIGILSMAAGHKSLNVKAVLDDYFRRTRQSCTAHVVHRLDRDTSGLMIYAKDIDTEQILEHDWHNIVYDRRYVAVVSGEMDDEGTVENWLKDNSAYVTYSSPIDNGGKYAVTHYHTLRRTPDFSLVEYRLETGRKNQIRVHSRRTRQSCTAHVVHRLDRDTSGLMIYAKDIDTEQILEHDWHNIVFDRRYVAVVSGEMDDEGTVENWLKDNSAYVTYSSPIDNGGKYAVTHYHTLRRTPDFSLVEYRLETGRKNQIRVHSADLGHPVCGDVKYGDGSDPVHRLCLHAYMLCFYHPVTHEPMEFETPIPPVFLKLFKGRINNNTDK
jgi:23S rRNA pseudouridine1911/1915/1917 synthase